MSNDDDTPRTTKRYQSHGNYCADIYVGTTRLANRIGPRVDSVFRVTKTYMNTKDTIEQIVDEQFPNRVVSVEERVVWVSGMNANCVLIANRIAKELVHGYDIPCSLVYHDDADRFGGVEFRYGDAA